MREIRLYGKLGARFGQHHRMEVASPAEAIRALCANYPEFERYMLESKEGYKVFIDQDDVTDGELLRMNAGAERTIRIAPYVIGAKNGGIFGILTGAALIGFSFWNPAIASTALWGSTTIGSIAGSMGFSLLLGGVSQLITGTPKSAGPSERPENKPSQFFDGPVNTTAQGGAVPIGYGECWVGSVVISAGLSVVDVPLV